MNQIFYKKVGRKYIPVSEYDYEISHALPKGNHLISVYPGGQSCRYNIDPAFAPMIAAGRYAEDTVSKAIVAASDLRPSITPLTQEQKDAWDNLSKSFGQESHMLQWPAAQDIARLAITTLQNEADMLLLNPAVKLAYEEFMIICKLTKETQNDTND